MGEEKISKVPEMQEKFSSLQREEKHENNLTISTKLSTEQLICKTPQESPNTSVKSLKPEEIREKISNNDNGASYTSLLYMGILQILFGLLMAVFGVLVIVHNARLAQLGGGLWGGCLAVASGTTGVLAAAKNWCPLKSSAQRVAHTVFLALSLISVAVSQLVLVLAATGLARDINHSDFSEEEEITTTSRPEELFLNLPANYLVILSNAGLIIVSGLQCVCAAIASYQSARALCPCFRDQNEMIQQRHQADAKDAFVNSWLGKHTLPPPLYVVAAPTNTGKRSKLSNALTVGPVLSLPPSVLSASPMRRYPLIPAPLGPVPSPIIRPRPKDMYQRKQKRYHSSDHHVQKVVAPQEKRRKSRSKSKEKQITTEEVVRTYTGLDRTIAEEFIEICDSHNTSLCSNSSCQNSCENSSCSGCTACTSVHTGSDVTSRDEKL